MIVLLVILAILAVLIFTPIGMHVLYDENGIVVKAVLGLIQFQIVPGKPNKPGDPERAAEEKRRKQEAKAAKKAEKQRKKALKRSKSGEAPAKTTPEPLGAKLQEFLPLIKLGVQAIGDLRTIFTVRKLHLRVTYGGEDAGKVAMNYGLAWSVCGAGMAILTKAFRIKKYDVEPVLDYGCRELRITADACVTLTLGRVMAYLVRYGIKALKILSEKKKNEKAVQQHESSST